jgi:hypothetical protein
MEITEKCPTHGVVLKSAYMGIARIIVLPGSHDRIPGSYEIPATYVFKCPTAGCTYMIDAFDAVRARHDGE